MIFDIMAGCARLVTSVSDAVLGEKATDAIIGLGVCAAATPIVAMDKALSSEPQKREHSLLGLSHAKHIGAHVEFVYTFWVGGGSYSSDESGVVVDVYFNHNGRETVKIFDDDMGKEISFPIDDIRIKVKEN